MNNKEFVKKWKCRLRGQPKTAADNSLYNEDWASDGNGSYIDLKDIPDEWFSELDKFLESVNSRCPDFIISQLKLKFGGVRIYLQNVTKEIHKEAAALEQSLYSEDLVW